MSDLAGGLYESAVYCRPNDEKRPGLVGITDFTTLQICPDDLTAGAENPGSALYGLWYVRIIFDELLDPKVEDLVPILDEDGLPTETFCGTIETTRPVILRCEDADGVMQEIPYDGYYVPNGNAVTWPLGPSLVIQPFDTSVVPPSGQCTVQINDSVVDKDGNPPSSTDLGEFQFQVQDLEIFDFFPDGEEIPTTDGFWEVVFNAPIDVDSVCNPDCIADADFIMMVDGQTVTDPAAITVFPDAGGLVDIVTNFEPGHEYTLIIPETATINEGVRTSNPTSLVVTDPAENDNNQISSFTTEEFALLGIEGGSSTPIAPVDAAIFLDFNSPMDDTSLAATEFTLVDGSGTAVTGAGYIVSGGTFIIYGDFEGGETYTFTLNAGATVQDLSTTPNVYTNPTAVTQMFTTQEVAIDELGPDGESIAISDGPGFFLSFNQYMDCTTFTAADFTITPALAGTTITCDDAFGPGSFVEVFVDGTFVEGTTYTFTLNANAAIDSVFGENFVNATAQSVTLQVVSDPEPQEPNACFTQNL